MGNTASIMEFNKEITTLQKEIDDGNNLIEETQKQIIYKAHKMNAFRYIVNELEKSLPLKPYK